MPPLTPRQYKSSADLWPWLVLLAPREEAGLRLKWEHCLLSAVESFYRSTPSARWQRLTTEGVPFVDPTSSKRGKSFYRRPTVTNAHNHTHTHTHTNVENQWISCTCLNRLELHYMDMKCEDTHTYLPMNNWVYTTHTVIHTHTKQTTFPPAHTRNGLKIFLSTFTDTNSLKKCQTAI